MTKKNEEKEGVMITSKSEKLKKWPRKKSLCCLNDYRVDYSSRIL